MREYPHGARTTGRTASDILVAAQKTGRSGPFSQEPREVCPKGCKQGMPYFPLHFEVDEPIFQPLQPPAHVVGHGGPFLAALNGSEPVFGQPSARRPHGVRCAPYGYLPLRVVGRFGGWNVPPSGHLLPAEEREAFSQIKSSFRFRLT